MKNGGCFHLSMQNYKSNGLIEIKKCIFSNSTAKNQKDGKGGAVYIDAKENSIQINIIECLFGRCFASLSGGAIYFNAVHRNISECTFENNEANYGSQIAYKLGENLTITDNVFIRNSKFDGMKNLTEFLIFSLSGSKIEPQNNRVLIDESLFDINFFNGIRKHQKVTAEKTDTLCENVPSGFLNITDGSDFSKQNVYSCSRFFKNRLSVNQALLHIYQCKFTYIQSKTAIEVDSDGCTTDGSIEIVGCEFVRCNEGAVYIKSKPSSRMIKISGCSFTLCQHLGGATGISFNTAYDLIEKCHFLNGYGFDGTDISYDHEVLDDSSYDLKLTITECIFERKYSYNKGGPFIKFTKNTTFNLINNHFNFYFDLYGFHIFDWPSNLNDISGISLDTFKQFVFECPENNPQTVICSGLNTNSDGHVNSRYVIGIYRCVFNGLSNTDDKRGGAIFISTSEIISDDLISPIKIYNSDFCKCKCSNGGAIYLESTEKSRLFEIESCFFSCNSYGKYNEKSISKGGAIFINSGIASFKISNSVFDINDCGEGAAIFFEI